MFTHNLTVKRETFVNVDKTLSHIYSNTLEKVNFCKI